MQFDEQTHALIADPATRTFRPLGALLYLAAATPVAMGIIGLFFWATDDGTGDPLGMKFIFGFACFFVLMGAGFFRFARRHAQDCLWIGPRGLFDSRVMTRALDWSEITGARLVDYRVGQYPAEAIAISTRALEDVSRAGPRLRAFNRGVAGMPDLPVQVSGMAGGAAPILEAVRVHLPVDGREE